MSEAPWVPPRVGKTAIVIGASMAGLCVARVLSERFDHVQVLDRDSLPSSPTARGQVPQGRHPHLLLVAGARLVEEWFPGILDELESGGAVDVDLVRDLYWYKAGGVARRPPSDLHGPTMSRPFLEWTVRRRVEAIPNVIVRDGVTVDGLGADTTGERITSVRIRDGIEEPCDLVVDATGRQARSLVWLQALGYEDPPVSRVQVDTRYVTRLYGRTALPSRDWKVAAVIDDPATKRLAMAVPVEGDRWMVLFGGLHGECAPTDDEELLAYARSYPSQVVAEVMEASEPIGRPVAHRFPASQRRHVERLRRFPLGWVLLGDAVCSFNPIYGQGMTSAAQQAIALGSTLDRAGSVDRSFTLRYFKAASRIVATPWSIAVGGDFTYEDTKGNKPPGADLVNRYMGRLIIAGQHDDAVAIRIVEVLGLVRPPTSLMTPAFALRALRAARRGPVGLEGVRIPEA